ncbi:alpha-1,2-mannosyltransferase ALG11 KNAG_0H02170 [Huiozyma naganishii CBS 8797]|uniref:GDP-Man:Man(3)GlcNAc(2)-PP-Dol alpha-1,2-mannosyltransferase n=1 Tax=Huiozyma naganishii (strain ATCC MYA-139 / BCRC 22969 / CBS 8797 / KCTC 17520 / NBRC 10181 / NCYC 3082 / Yp74L-3) TaxID=1071383 RepID=J7S9P9_HUIN7|nr:hypothetical protein KNAG_0H02170 [Kazachstania naganishii CBS 8797]CCK71631.1 hypothetical protein KNAG_0H02170 [Kazachstania naganishii CBS 8797]
MVLAAVIATLQAWLAACISWWYAGLRREYGDSANIEHMERTLLKELLRGKQHIKFSELGNDEGYVRAVLIRHCAHDVSLYGGECIPTDDTERAKLVSHLQARIQGTQDDNVLFGFFHPFCNAGGGGEKVLWKAVQTTLDHDPRNVAIVYTGDTDVTGPQILTSVVQRFDYTLPRNRIVFVFLKGRDAVDAKNHPRLTLLFQGIGSCKLAHEALSRCKPDVWCDTMGYPLAYLLVFAMIHVPIVTYTHYPLIQQDMLNSQGLSTAKKMYWSLLMGFYMGMAQFVTVCTTNSTWTNRHMTQIWHAMRETPQVIYPPCSTEKLVEQVTPAEQRANTAVVLAQFRPEKRHRLILDQYAMYADTVEDPTSRITLTFIGSTRSQEDRDYVQQLIEYAREVLHLPARDVRFLTDCSYDEVKEQLGKATYGINAMWNEHFGIAVVEYIAAGLIPLVHASAGPLLDIVSPQVGFFFVDKFDRDYTQERGTQYGTLAAAFKSASQLSAQDKHTRSTMGVHDAVTKFSDQTFETQWIEKVLQAL